MDERFVRQIILEVIDRFCFDQNRTKKSIDLTGFPTRDIACAFLRQYQGENLLKTQKLKIWFKSQELHFRVHDLIYEQPAEVNNTTVQFIYRKLLFGEIKWPSVQVQRLTRVRWASDNDEFSPLNSIQLYQNEVVDDDYSSIDIEPCVPPPSTSVEYATSNKTEQHFQTSIYIQLNRMKF